MKNILLRSVSLSALLLLASSCSDTSYPEVERVSQSESSLTVTNGNPNNTSLKNQSVIVSPVSGTVKDLTDKLIASGKGWFPLQGALMSKIGTHTGLTDVLRTFGLSEDRNTSLDLQSALQLNKTEKVLWPDGYSTGDSVATISAMFTYEMAVMPIRGLPNTMVVYSRTIRKNSTYGPVIADVEDVYVVRFDRPVDNAVTMLMYSWKNEAGWSFKGSVTNQALYKGVLSDGQTVDVKNAQYNSLDPKSQGFIYRFKAAPENTLTAQSGQLYGLSLLYPLRITPGDMNDGGDASNCLTYGTGRVDANYQPIYMTRCEPAKSVLITEIDCPTEWQAYVEAYDQANYDGLMFAGELLVGSIGINAAPAAFAETIFNGLRTFGGQATAAFSATRVVSTPMRSGKKSRDTRDKLVQCAQAHGHRYP